MKLPRPTTLPRRKVVAGGLAALALGFQTPAVSEARPMLARGMAGGGLARLESGGSQPLAQFSLFASAMQLPEGNTLFLGKILWVEAGAGLQLESTEITQCVALEDRPDGAQIRGRMTVNGEGDYPFVIHAFDSSLPGTGKDSIMIEVDGRLARELTETDSEAIEPAYTATASIVAGDFQWIIADIDLP